MTRALSLKLDESIFAETERIRKRIHKARNAYINEAVAFYNELNERKALKSQLARESAAVCGTSMEVLKEFEALEHRLP